MLSPSSTTSLEGILRRKIREEGRVPRLATKRSVRFGMLMIGCPACGLSFNVPMNSFNGGRVIHGCPKCRKSFELHQHGYVYNGRRVGTEEFELG